MKTRRTGYAALLVTSLLVPTLEAAEVAGDSQRGAALWLQEFTVKGEQRSCSTCHTADPSKAGKHQRTAKRIEPMAVSANGKRFTRAKKVARWFKRNCSWTMGRECTAQEKADIVQYLKTY